LPNASSVEVGKFKAAILSAGGRLGLSDEVLSGTVSTQIISLEQPSGCTMTSKI
jgi:hypothetical protein